MDQKSCTAIDGQEACACGTHTRERRLPCFGPWRNARFPQLYPPTALGWSSPPWTVRRDLGCAYRRRIRCALEATAIIAIRGLLARRHTNRHGFPGQDRAHLGGEHRCAARGDRRTCRHGPVGEYFRPTDSGRERVCPTRPRAHGMRAPVRRRLCSRGIATVFIPRVIFAGWYPHRQASDDRTVRVWDREPGAPLAVRRGLRHVVRAAEYSPDGTRIVTASDDGTAAHLAGTRRYWRAASAAQDTKTGSRSANFSPDGTRIVTASLG